MLSVHCICVALAAIDFSFIGASPFDLWIDDIAFYKPDHSM